ncbi:dTDP-4-dehydrorhamnose reductase [Providencia alcalifaciens]|uniref:dTDP-4-dehydrorhamnose reductase n=1 Tax=Providencia alcalifaciens TaxID=126385 RepID=UPI000446F3A1|nr:dTDP-4-dehydrorhamnose reductase [Providencia alcalifaciens]ETT07682.1 dTDP-4-dehydrorhamnose reductase [Providencia alcalifaciens F90-2004]EUC94973.1 dTDP-4-dehydrorhamnose reductase [Providencia alcalifaciens PAL-2]MTB33171.1 dTDP-4-dehydrorhamnose reductase [Providencia alcalifaciens]MTC97592.1 dTDP-4-dehydrorhamnose reductase [Providencia alcalifaciens]
MKILLLGKNGQVGWELQRALSPLGELIALDRYSKNYCGDLSNLDALAKTVEQLKPDVIVNAAAYTAVDKAENEPTISKLINSDAVKTLAISAHKINALLIHYSTDYVFSGEGSHFWNENDKTSALNTYGKTKLDGEKNIQQYCPNHLILRTSWVYSTLGNNFAKTILNLAKTREKLSVINDQYGAPTSAELIADCTAIALIQTLQDKSKCGIYHLVSSGSTNWYQYANLVTKEAMKNGIELVLKELNAIPAIDYPLPAKRPYNSKMNNTKFRITFNTELPSWELGVKRLIKELSI